MSRVVLLSCKGKHWVEIETGKWADFSRHGFYGFIIWDAIAGEKIFEGGMHTTEDEAFEAGKAKLDEIYGAGNWEM